MLKNPRDSLITYKTVHINSLWMASDIEKNSYQLAIIEFGGFRTNRCHDLSVPKISSGFEIVVVSEIISHSAQSSGSSFFRWVATHL